MVRKGPGKLPTFKTDEELARFFDTHDLADYADQLEDVDDVFVLAPALARKIRERAKKEMIAIRLERWQIGRAKKIARDRGVPYQQLLREWISRGIRSDHAEKRRAQ